MSPDTLSSASLLEAADVARDGPRRDAEGLADLPEAEALAAELRALQAE